MSKTKMATKSKAFTATDVVKIMERAPLILERDGFTQNALHDYEEAEIEALRVKWVELRNQRDYLTTDEYTSRQSKLQQDVYKAKTHCMLGAMHIAAIELKLLDNLELDFFGEESVTEAFDEAFQADSDSAWHDWLEMIPSFNDREKTTKKKAIKKFAKLKQQLIDAELAAGRAA